MVKFSKFTSKIELETRNDSATESFLNGVQEVINYF